MTQQDEATENLDHTPEAPMDDTPKATMDDTPKATMDDTPEATMDDTPQATMDDTPEVTVDDTAKAVLITTDTEACVLPEVTEEATVDDTLKATMDATPEAPMLITTNTEARELTEETGVEFLLSKLEKFQETLKLVEEHDLREEEAREWERSSVYRTPEPESRDSGGSDSQTLRLQTEVADAVSQEEPDVNPTYAKMVADARRRTEELKRKGLSVSSFYSLISRLLSHGCIWNPAWNCIAL